MTETVDAKALRLARTSVTVDFESDDWPPLLVATVQGDTGRYETRLNPDGSSECDCEAGLHHRNCSHIRALRVYEQYGRIWAAEQKARERMANRDDNRPPGRHQ